MKNLSEILKSSIKEETKEFEIQTFYAALECSGGEVKKTHNSDCPPSASSGWC